MLNRYESALKLLCLGLAILLALQVARVMFRADPLGKLKIPEIPTLAGESTNAPSGKGGTNAPGSTNAVKGTNAIGSTNNLRGTNGIGATNAIGTTNAISGTNTLTGTNTIGATNVVRSTNTVSATNTASVANAANGTNNSNTSHNSPNTNTPSTTNVSASKTNSPAVVAGGSRPPGMPGMGMPGMPGMPGMGGPPSRPLSPQVKARVDRVIAKEILAPVMHPMPMALLGIASQSAFLRATNGQTGIVKVGEDVGGLKLLRIGINRVLVEQGGQTNELTIFSGYGSESLLPKEQNK